MWPDPGEALSRTVEAEAAVSGLYAEALARWMPTARDAVLPSLAGLMVNGDPALIASTLPPDPAALTQAQSVWDEHTDQVIVAGLSILWAVAVYETVTELGETIADAVTPDLDTVVLGIVLLSLIGLSRKDVQAAVAHVDATPALAAARADFLEQRRGDIAAVPGRVAGKVQAALADPQLTMSAPPEERSAVLRARATEVLAVDSPEMRTVTTAEGYQAAGVMNHAVLAAAQQQQAELPDDERDELEAVWISTLDGRTRPTHWSVDGARVPLGSTFTVGQAQLRYPGDPSGPPEEIMNCVVGSTQVTWPGQDVLEATLRRHSGTFVDLVTADGRKLTITANHKVLTPAGYIAADSLRPGDYVIGASSAEVPEVGDVPPRIEELYRSMSELREPQRVVARAVDFHGDISEGDVVGVVRADGDLRGEVGEGGDVLQRAAVVESSLLGDGAGVVGDLVLSVGGHSAGASLRAAGRVGGLGVAESFVGTHAAHSNSVGLSATADLEPSYFEVPDHSGAAESEDVRHLEHAHAAGMEPVELSRVDVYSATHDVYNLSTTQEWYTGNGIAVHNCRCRMGVLAADEALPDEVDRHTERLNGRDSVAVNRDGRTQQEEIDRRRDAGNVRARDTSDGIGRYASPKPEEMSMTTKVTPNTLAARAAVTAAADADGAETFLTFSGYIGKLGVATSDRRILATDIDLTMREFPHPMAWQKQAVGGHYDSFTVGVVEEAKIDGDWVWASGYFLNSPEAEEAADQVNHKVSAPSLDLAACEYIFSDENGKEIEGDLYDWWEENGEPYMYFTAAEQTGFTLVQTPAFDGIDITLGERETRDLAVVASIVASVDGPRVKTYDPTLFDDPKLTRPTAPTMNNTTGRIYGHLAEWGHTIRGGREVTPRNHNGYLNFHTSQVMLDNGKQLSVGRLTVQGGHADTSRGVTVATARAHYDNVCQSFGLVRVGEDQFGIWFSGVPAPGVDPEVFQQGMTCQLSGDWRDCAGSGLDMIAAHAVNSPGFPIYSAVTGPDGREVALVASLGPSRASKTVGGGFTLDRETLKVLLTEVVETVDRRRDDRDAHRARTSAALAAASGAVGDPPPEPTLAEQIEQLLKVHN
jgi:hypothetical protein